MMVGGLLRSSCLCLIVTGPVWAQSLPTSATIESIPVELTMPEEYHVIAALEPVRRIALVAPADGIVRSIEAALGASLRANQEIAQLDRSEAVARLKMAQAEVKEKQALVKGSQKGIEEVHAAQLDAAQAKAELAQLQLDSLSLRAPFGGRITALTVSAGQYVLKGTVIAELSDVTSFKSLVPVDRRTAAEGAELKVYVEEQELKAKIQSILPLPESYAHLRELAAPFAAAWVTVPNTKGDLAAGLRVRSATLPVTPLATIPKDAVKTAEAGATPGAAAAGAIVQVIRNQYVANVPVDVLGKVGAERVQVTGALRSTDALVVASSVPLLPGTLIRFGPAPERGIEGTTPNPARQGVEAGITPPAGAAPATNSLGRPRPVAPGTPAARPPRRPQGQPPAPAVDSQPF